MMALGFWLIEASILTAVECNKQWTWFALNHSNIIPLISVELLLDLAQFEGRLRPEVCFDSIHVLLQITVRNDTPNHLSPTWHLLIKWKVVSNFICNISYTFGL